MKSILVSEHNTFLAGSHRRKLDAGEKNGCNCQSGLIWTFFRLTSSRAERLIRTQESLSFAAALRLLPALHVS